MTPACLGGGSWAVGEYLTDCHSSVERYPEASPEPEHAGAGEVFGLPWARSAFMAFCLRESGANCPNVCMEGNAT